MTAEFMNLAMLVNTRKVRRIMVKNGLNPKRKRLYVVTADSNHDNPI